MKKRALLGIDFGGGASKATLLSETGEILATAGNGKIPILLRKKFGQGSITVLTATACGPAKNNSFWKTSILENIINYLHNN